MNNINQNNASFIWDHLNDKGDLEWSSKKQSLDVETNIISIALHRIRDTFADLLNLNLTSTYMRDNQISSLLNEDQNMTFKDSAGKTHTFKELLEKMPESNLFKSYHTPKDDIPIQQQIRQKLGQP